MKDGVPALSLGSEQQSSHCSVQQAFVDVVVRLVALLEHDNSHTNCIQRLLLTPCCRCSYLKKFVVFSFTTCILIFFGAKIDTKTSELPDLWLLSYWRATETQRLQLLLLWQETLSYLSIHSQRKCPCLTNTQPSLIFMQCGNTALSLSAHQQGKTWHFPQWVESPWSFCLSAELRMCLSCCMTSYSTWNVILSDPTDVIGAPIQF